MADQHQQHAGYYNFEEEAKRLIEAIEPQRGATMTVLCALHEAFEAGKAESLSQSQGWQDIATAPKDGTRVDLWAKCWRAELDDFISKRYPDCYWTTGDSMTGRRKYWVDLDQGWHATHWQPLPSPPVTAKEPTP